MKGRISTPPQLVSYGPPATLTKMEIQALKRKNYIDEDWEEMCGAPSAPPFRFACNGKTIQFDSPHRPFRRVRREHDAGELLLKGRTPKKITDTHTAFVPDDDRSNYQPTTELVLSGSAIEMLKSGKLQPLAQYIDFIGEEAARMTAAVAHQKAKHAKDLAAMEAGFEKQRADMRAEFEKLLNIQASEQEIDLEKAAKATGYTRSELEKIVADRTKSEKKPAKTTK